MTDEEIVDINNVLFKQSTIPEIFNTVCNKYHIKKSYGFICKDCPKSEICVDCFIHSEHRDHDYEFIFGYFKCDCGFKTKCSKHNISDEKLNFDFDPSVFDRVLANLTDKKYISWLEVVLSLNSNIVDIVAEKLSSKEYFEKLVETNDNDLFVIYSYLSYFNFDFFKKMAEFGSDYIFSDSFVLFANCFLNESASYQDIFDLQLLYTTKYIHKAFDKDILTNNNLLITNIYFTFSFVISESVVSYKRNKLTNNEKEIIKDAFYSIHDKFFNVNRMFGAKHDDDNEVVNFLYVQENLYVIFSKLILLDDNPGAYIDIFLNMSSDIDELSISLLEDDSIVNLNIIPRVMAMRHALINNYDFSALPEEKILCLILPVMRYFALLYLVHFNFFSRNPSNFIQFLNEDRKFLYTSFIVIQKFLPFIKDSDKFISTVSSIFGFSLELIDKNPSYLEDNEINDIIFSFFHFLLSLLYYKQEEEDEFDIKLIENLLYDKPMKLDEILRRLSNDIDTNVGLDIERIQSYLDRRAKKSEGSRAEVVYQVIKDCDILLPFHLSNVLMNNIGRMVSSSKEKSLLYLRNEQEISSNILVSSHLNSLIYLTLHRFTKLGCLQYNTVVHFILHLIKSMSKCGSPSTNNTNTDIYTIIDYSSSPNIISADFYKFINQKISYMSMPAVSTLEILLKIPSLTVPIFESIGVYCRKDEVDPTKKKKSQNIRQKLLERFKNNSLDFMDVDETQDTHRTECIICSLNDRLYIPISYIRSNIISLLIDEPKYISLAMNFCMHLIHKECMGENKTCPVDRSSKMDFLRYIPQEVLNSETLETHYYEPLENDFDDKILINTVANFVITTEQSSAEYTNSLKEVGFLRSLFYYVCVKCSKSENKNVQMDFPFAQFIYDMCINTSPFLYYQNNNSLFTENYPKYGHYVKMFGYLVYDLGVYEITKRSLLKDYLMKKLPNSFFDFLFPPYSLPFLSNESLSAHLAYSLIYEVPVGIFCGIPNIKHIRQLERDSCFDILLVLSGSHATELIIYRPDTEVQVHLTHVYVNDNGNSDIGLECGKKLYLSEYLVDNIAQKILTTSFLQNGF